MEVLNSSQFIDRMVAAVQASMDFIAASPLWVQIWVAIMLIAMLPAYWFMFRHSEARWVAWSGVILMIWTPILILAAGPSRLWGITHLSFWTPVFCVAVAGVMRNGLEGIYQKWLLAIATILGVSLLFDLLDVARFFMA